jgi:hypothetical protein
MFFTTSHVDAQRSKCWDDPSRFNQTVAMRLKDAGVEVKKARFHMATTIIELDFKKGLIEYDIEFEADLFLLEKRYGTMYLIPYRHRGQEPVIYVSPFNPCQRDILYAGVEIKAGASISQPGWSTLRLRQDDIQPLATADEVLLQLITQGAAPALHERNALETILTLCSRNKRRTVGLYRQ